MAQSTTEKGRKSEGKSATTIRSGNENKNTKATILREHSHNRVCMTVETTTFAVLVTVVNETLLPSPP